MKTYDIRTLKKNAIGNRWNPVRLYEEELIKPRKALQAMTQVKSLKTLGKVEAMKPHKTLTKTNNTLKPQKRSTLNPKSNPQEPSRLIFFCSVATAEIPRSILRLCFCPGLRGFLSSCVDTLYSFWDNSTHYKH